jgi:hypothetical protein
MRYAIIFALLLGGCAARGPAKPAKAPIVTTSVGSFDESAFETLTASNVLIERTKVELATSATGWPPQQAADISHALAWAIDSRDKTQKAYNLYRQAVISGGDSRPEFNELAERLHDLNAKTAILANAKKGETP